MAYGSIMSISNDSSEFNNAILKITGPKAGSTVTVTQGSTVINAIEDNGVWTAEVGKGSWIVSCTMSGLTDTKTVIINNYKIYNIVLEFLPDNLDDASWDKISDARKAGVIGNFYSIGDCKKITLNGNHVIYNNYNCGTYGFSCYVVLVDIDSSHLTFQFGKLENSSSAKMFAFTDAFYASCSVRRGSYCIQMNGNGYQEGGYFDSSHGWPDTWMRKHYLGGQGPSSANTSSNKTFYWCLPDDLRPKLISVSVHSGAYNTNYYSNDYITLPSEYEIRGSVRYYGSATHTGESQLDYYRLGNSQTKYQLGVNSGIMDQNPIVTVYLTRTYVREDPDDSESNYGGVGIGRDGYSQIWGCCGSIAPLFFV